MRCKANSHKYNFYSKHAQLQLSTANSLALGVFICKICCIEDPQPSRIGTTANDPVARLIYISYKKFTSKKGIFVFRILLSTRSNLYLFSVSLQPVQVHQLTLQPHPIQKYGPKLQSVSPGLKRHPQPNT